jgi:putative hydrolase of the HAD superfamily
VIKAVIFDCFGVLTTDLWREFCATLPDNQRMQARDLNHALDSGMLSHQDFVEGVQELTGRSSDQIEKIFQDEVPKNTQLLDYIATLKKSYKIGLISNVSNNWIRDSFLNTQEQALFDSMVMSFEVGVTKPAPQIYERACSELDVQPEEAIFIDDIEQYVTAAKELGMQGIVYHDFAQFQQDMQQLLA